MLTLYYTPGTCALATHILLEEAGADYHAERIDFATAQQRSPEYLKINPKSRVPALGTERGILTETPALLLYVAQTHPRAGLAPLDDPFALAEAQAFNNYLCATVHVAHAHRMRGYRWADDMAAQESMKAKVAANVGECFALIENTMFRGPWVSGDRFGLCDPYLFTLSQWLPGDGVDIAKYPRVADHFKRMHERPAVQRVLEVHKAKAA